MKRKSRTVAEKTRDTAVAKLNEAKLPRPRTMLRPEPWDRDQKDEADIETEAKWSTPRSRQWHGKVEIFIVSTRPKQNDRSQVEAKYLRPKPRPIPWFWGRGQGSQKFGLETLTSLHYSWTHCASWQRETPMTVGCKRQHSSPCLPHQLLNVHAAAAAAAAAATLSGLNTLRLMQYSHWTVGF